MIWHEPVAVQMRSHDGRFARSVYGSRSSAGGCSREGDIVIGFTGWVSMDPARHMRPTVIGRRLVVLSLLYGLLGCDGERDWNVAALVDSDGDGLNQFDDCDDDDAQDTRPRYRFKEADCQSCSERFTGDDCRSCSERFTGGDCRSCSERFTGTQCEIEFVSLAGGRFQMGGDGEYDGRPIHGVGVPGFEMSKTEVTVGQYRQCVNAGACTEPSDHWQNVPGERENHPVTYVNWQQAKGFAEFVGARLPTEAEWEYAAKGGGQNIVYPWGNEAPDCDRLNFNSCVGGTTPVCTYATGNTAQGLCDMAGNVWEWVEDDWHNS